VAEQGEWWEEMETLVRAKLQDSDNQMERKFEQKWGNHPRTWDFHLDPGDKVLMRQAIPGKNLQRAVGPLIYLRDKAGGRGAELITAKGKVVVAAKANLRPYRAAMGRPVEPLVQVSMPLGDDLDSESDWEEWMSDE
jgi:hypothetical protein